MNISGIDTSAFLGFRLPLDGEDVTSAGAVQAPQDTVDISVSALWNDEEAAGALSGVLGSLAADPYGAPVVHGGLTQSRVFELLGL